MSSPAQSLSVMSVPWVSVGVLGVVVLLCEAVRGVALRLPRDSYRLYLLEAASTFQLCCCSHELKLLSGSVELELPLGLALTYSMTVIHLLTFRDATCNPSGAVERACRGRLGLRAAGLIVACQFAAASAARVCAACVWSLGLSEVHVRHQRFDYRCFDPLGGTVLEAAAVELACTFTVQAAVMHIHRVEERVRAPLIAAVITALVFTGGSISGAVFNPVLAFSIQFPCSGHTYLEYCFIYWLGPVLGMVSCILLFEKILPFLSGKDTTRRDVAAALKQKTQ